jgi:hypothetical protein
MTKLPELNACIYIDSQPLTEYGELYNSNNNKRHPRSGVLLVSANSRNRAGLLVGAYLLCNGVCSTAIDALSLWSELRADGHLTSRTISKGVSNKMYQLYLSYFGHFCTNSMDALVANAEQCGVYDWKSAHFVHKHHCKRRV